MRRAHTVETVRRAEAELMARLPAGTLMARAATGLATIAARILRDQTDGVYGARVLLLIGSGDNGGDALFAGARLARRGAHVEAALTDPERAHAAGLADLLAAGGRVIAAPAPASASADSASASATAPHPAAAPAAVRPTETTATPTSTSPDSVLLAARKADLIIDGLVGIGGKGGLREPAAAFARAAATSGTPVLAVDLPSGIDADTGEVNGETVTADVTVTFGTYKPGLLIDPAAERAGVVEFVDIGLGPALADPTSGHPPIAAPNPAHASPSSPNSAPDADLSSNTGPIPDSSPNSTPNSADALNSGVSPNANSIPNSSATSVSGLDSNPHSTHHASNSGFLPETAAVEALQSADAAALLPPLAHETDKYGRGVAGIECGSTKYPGAARLCVGGALHSGVGAVRYSGPESVGQAVLADFPEVMVGRARSQAWVVGCGLDRDTLAAERLRDVLALDTPVLIDADALALLAEQGPGVLADRQHGVVLTPHAGEAAGLLHADRGQVEAHRLDSVRRLADTYGATVLLKGTTTLIAEPGRVTVRANPTGTPALATAGSGDVLAGLIGGLLAAGLEPFDAASLGAYLHGLAGRRAQSRRPDSAPAPITAPDLLHALPGAWRTLAAH
jgi:ADP-dependent NAD(P)H-hydrate dehydratase / NAD(P)H-hydrate epimerase